MKTHKCPLCHNRIIPLEEYPMWSRETYSREAHIEGDALEIYLHVNDPRECVCNIPTCPVCYKSFDKKDEQFPWLKFAIHWTAFGDMDDNDHKLSSMISGE